MLLLIYPCSPLVQWSLCYVTMFLRGLCGPTLKMVKGKFHPRTGHKGPEGEWWHSSTLSLTSALDGVGRQLHASADLPSGNARYPLYRKLGRPLGWSGRLGKISPLTGILSPDRPARSELLYRMSYPDPPKTLYVKTKWQHRGCITTKRYTTIITNNHFEMKFLTKFRYFLRKNTLNLAV